MRLLLCLALLIQGLCAQSYVRVSKKNPRYLELSDGKSYVPVGLNIGWERFATGETEVFALTEKRFAALAAARGDFARIFLGHPFYQLDPVTPGEIEEAKLRRVDRLVALAKKHGIRLKMCLEHFRTVQNDPPKFPGSVPMGAPHYGTVFADMTDYFSSAKGRAVFLAKLDALSARYANEPAIFGWELWNEINSSRQEGWEEWTRKMLPELKKRFPRHLAMQSLGSFDSESKSELYRTFSVMAGNELAQSHRYLDEGAALSLCRGPMDVLSVDAVTRLLSYTKDRPVLLSEVGAVEPRHAGPFRFYKKDTEGVLLHDGLFAPFFAGSAGGGQFWHWQDYVEPNNLWYHFARFAEAIRGLDPREEDFRPTRMEHAQLRVYVLQGRRTTLLWLRDIASDWQSELAEGKPAGELKNLLLPVSGTQADVYDPWTNRHTTVRIRGGQLRLPAFRRSLVIRIEAPRG